MKKLCLSFIFIFYLVIGDAKPINWKNFYKKVVHKVEHHKKPKFRNKEAQIKLEPYNPQFDQENYVYNSETNKRRSKKGKKFNPNHKRGWTASRHHYYLFYNVSKGKTYYFRITNPLK